MRLRDECPMAKEMHKFSSHHRRITHQINIRVTAAHKPYRAACKPQAPNTHARTVARLTAMDLSLLLNADADADANADTGIGSGTDKAEPLRLHPYDPVVSGSLHVSVPRDVKPPPLSLSYAPVGPIAPLPTRDLKPLVFSPALPGAAVPTHERECDLKPVTFSPVLPPLTPTRDLKTPVSLLNFLPHRPSSWHKTLPTSPVSRPATPPTPVAIPTSPSAVGGVDVAGVGTKRRELRAVGQAHRDRQRDEQDALADYVAELQRTNTALYNGCMEMMRGTAQAQPRQLRALLRAEVSGTRSCVGMHPVSDVFAARLGVRYLTGAMALVLLEYVAARRNLVHVARRPRVAELTCPERTVYDTVLQKGVVQIRAEANRLAAMQYMDPDEWVTEILAALASIHEQWSIDEGEACVDATGFAAARAAKLANIHAGRAGNGKRRPKKCHRCGMERSAGSGHPRGFCKLDDAKSTNSNSRMTDDDEPMS